MSKIVSPGDTGIKLMLRPTGRRIYAPRSAFDVKPVEPRRTDPESWERDERDAWEWAVYRIAKYHGISLEKAEALARKAREQELARIREDGK